MRLTVAKLLKFLEDENLHPTTEVFIDYETDYDGQTVVKSGPADDCLIVQDGKLVISGCDHYIELRHKRLP